LRCCYEQRGAANFSSGVLRDDVLDEKDVFLLG
jgi:hypothetical protein